MIGHEGFFYQVFSPDGSTGSGSYLEHDLEWLTKEITQPGSIVAYDEISLPAFDKPQILKPQAIGLPFSVQISDVVAQTIKNTHATALLHISSKLAQAGLDIYEINYDPMEKKLNGRLQNVGPFTLELPPQAELNIGIPYLRSETPIDEPSLYRIVSAFNNINTSKKRKNHIQVFGKIQSSEPHPQDHYMTIATPRILVHPHLTKKLDLSTLPRGTQREKLHGSQFLDLQTIDIESIKRKLQTADPDKILTHIFQSYGNGLDVPYALTETNDPINYPEGYGIEIVGGVILEYDGTPNAWISHSASVVGQHRGERNPKVNPRHRLLSEFYYRVADLLHGIISEGQSVALVCSPVRLVWAQQKM